MKLKIEEKQEASTINIIRFISVIIVGFVLRMILFQAFEWVWEIIEADKFELCKNIGDRNQCIDS